MGGGSDKAQREAQAAEERRRRDIAATQQRIDAIYADPRREADIRDIEAATSAYLTGDLNRQNATATRELKFAHARNGTTMGSADVDSNRRLSEDYLRAAVEVQRRAGQAGNALRQADFNSKTNLFSLAQQGLDMSTAARQAGEAMRVDAANAKANALETGLGDLFSNLGNTYKRSRERAGEQKAEKFQYGTFYAPPSWYSPQGFGGNGGGW